MGAAVGDYDGDGHVDLFVSAVGTNHLYHNDGEGHFTEVTDQADVAGSPDAWSSSCGWFDYDNDGDLDLFVCNYVSWSREYDEAQDFQLTGGGRAYGRPQNFAGSFPYLYRNDGDGRFTEVAAAAGLQMRNPATGVPMAKSLGLALADFDQDGWMDVVVANDTVQNFFFRNRGDGTFEEFGARVGVAFDMNGNARGAMGIDVARFRNNDALGIAIGNFANEMTALYVAYQGQHAVHGRSDLDGTRTQYAIGAHVRRLLSRRRPRWSPRSAGRQRAPGRRNQSSSTQSALRSSRLSCSGTAVPSRRPSSYRCRPKNVATTCYVPWWAAAQSFADIDGDGDLDILLTAIGSSPRLLRNDQQLNHHWLRVKLIGTQSNRDAIGAWIEVQMPGADSAAAGDADAQLSFPVGIARHFWTGRVDPD